MNLNQLTYVSEIERLGSFSRAAQTLYLSQSALSKSIHALEVELDQEIFTRTTEGITITEFGRAFLEEAEKTLEHVEKIRNMAKRKPERDDKVMKFSVSCGQMLFAGVVFARLLARFTDTRTDFRFYQRSCSEVFLDVKEERSSLGLLMTLNPYTQEAKGLFEENQMDYQTLGRLQTGVAVSHTNSIYERGVDRIKKGMLSNQFLVLIRETIAPFTREEEELRMAFDNPQVVYVADNDTAVNLCSQLPAYICIAQSYKIYSKLNLPLSMNLYPYQNMNLKYEFGLIKKKQTELTRAEKLFVDEIKKLFR